MILNFADHSGTERTFLSKRRPRRVFHWNKELIWRWNIRPA